jgi:uncharacterized protein YjbI with pentapeptide repeats
MACEFDGSSAIQNIAPTYQRQLWTSTDGGASWIPQPPADTGFDADRPPLPDAAACAGLDLQTVTATYGSSARLVDLTADRISVWSADGLRIVTSTDGLTWTTAVLDGAIAVASERVPAPEVNSKASAIFAVDGQYVAMNLEEYRNFDDTATASSVGLSVVTWTSADGETWQRQPLGRPILVTDHAASYQFFVVDGQLALRAFDPVDAVEFGVYQSIVGEAEDWFTCVATSGANCAFSTEVSAFEPGADLSGIDLSFASLEGRDLTDVSFEGARLWSTGLVGVTINRTNFDGADISTTQLVGDLSTSSFVGATLTNISFDPQFFVIELTGATINSPGIVVGEAGLPEGLSMVGRDLTNFEFSQGDLSGVDFSGANLTDASFSFVDLSGAVFAGAVLDSVFFYEVTCPDGQPLTEGALEAALCRL